MACPELIKEFEEQYASRKQKKRRRSGGKRKAEVINRNYIKNKYNYSVIFNFFNFCLRKEFFLIMLNVIIIIVFNYG